MAVPLVAGAGALECRPESAHASVLRLPALAEPIRITPLVVLGKLRARRGDPDPWGPLDEALELALATGEVQRLAPVAAARAEACWLGGEPERVREETDGALALACTYGNAWELGELYSWRRHAGIDERPPVAIAEPYRLELTGEPEAASKLWRRLGCPYERAIALAGSRDEAPLRWSLAELQRLGARAAAARVARTLRERGVRDLRQGPRAATLGNVAGLTRARARGARACRGGDAQLADRRATGRYPARRSITMSPRSSESSTPARAPRRSPRPAGRES